jgi:hypothetical protein
MTTRYYTRKVNKKRGDSKQAQWSPKQKFEAVALYRTLGSLRAVSDSTGIPIDTIKHWHLTDWWKEYELEITTEARIVRSKRLDKIINKSAEILEDRLENGDWVLDPEGKPRRKPINANTASKILTTTIDREVLLEKLQQENKQLDTKEEMDVRLSKLFQEFQKFAKSKTIEIVREDEPKGGDPILELKEIKEHAIHEEREEGLQSGVELGEHQGDTPLEGSGGAPQSARPDGEAREGP